MKKALVLVFTVLWGSVFSQEPSSANTKRLTIKKWKQVDPEFVPETYNAHLIYHEAPNPGGDSEKGYILRQKMKSKQLFPVRRSKKYDKSIRSALMPKVGKGFRMERTVFGTVYPIIGRTPNDNTLAISNDGILLLGINSLIYAYDLNGDSALFSGGFISLEALSGLNSLSSYYDPKVIYDKDADRFILIFLKDLDPDNSEIMVCFSTTNNPKDPWNLYKLPGNPLDNNRWTDFPAIAITDTDLFITANLIIPGISWQLGFDGSMVWQIGKQEGYQGMSELNTILYDNIKFNGNFVRNLHPVQGADGAVDELYFLSNRNFDITNDSIFIGHIAGTSIDASTKLSINAYQSNLKYGMPPNGKQQDTDISDVTSGLQTNDARVLGAVKIGDNIQFVSNTIDPATGLAAIYHGTISSISDQPIITASIIGDTVKDYGYPNIAWTGNEACDIETIIAFNYSSFTNFPGISCVYYDNEGNYSNEKTIKKGENYVNRLRGSYERWGDYFGLQRYYAKPGMVYSFGYYGDLNRRNGGWIAELVSPDSSALQLSFERAGQASFCSQTITMSVVGGVPPYNYNWINYPLNNTNTIGNFCLGDSVEVNVVDARGCSANAMVYAKSIPIEQGDSKVYPNPFSSNFAVQFNLEAAQQITARIFDLSGRLVTDLLQRNAKKGLNELIFSLIPLNVGKYVLVVEANGKEILNEKIIKNE